MKKEIKIRCWGVQAVLWGVQEIKRAGLGLEEAGTGSVQSLGRVQKKPNRLGNIYRVVNPFSSFSLSFLFLHSSSLPYPLFSLIILLLVFFSSLSFHFFFGSPPSYFSSSFSFHFFLLTTYKKNLNLFHNKNIPLMPLFDRLVLGVDRIETGFLLWYDDCG
jgi:hypothetical protein